MGLGESSGALRERIAVIGAGGAGKTHMARALGCAPDLPAGLRPRLDRQFLAYVLGFRRRRRPALLAELARWSHGRTVVVLRSRRAVKRFIAHCHTPDAWPGG